MKIDRPKPIYLKDYAPSDYLIDTVDLDIALDPNETRVKARLRVRPNPAARTKGRAKVAPLVLDGELITLESVKISGRKATAK
ncbi:MAG: hypothetical protein AAGJ70_12270, partial [Pseudomonadota bacterium]